MRITPEQIAHLAWLARLELRPEEKTRLAEDLDRILEYMRQLDAVEIDRVEPLTHSVDRVGPLRDDDVLPGVAREAALANAPEREGEFFAVPTVVELTRRDAPPLEGGPEDGHG
jgi:aspartyl-tRNA(Asn)/glutamyl-tRNA(Gln) amidotransferase subunit C